MHSIVIVLLSLSSLALARPGGLLAAPYAAVAPVAGLTSSQYHAQDELGQYSYGYAGGPSSKAETKTADGITRGSYSYVDSYGLVQTTNYVSDPVNGFRVAATNLPVGPSGAAPAAIPLAAAPVAVAPYAAAPLAAAPYAAAFPAVPISTAYSAGVAHVAQLPLPPADTPEVTAAKLQHFAAHAEANLRA